MRRFIGERETAPGVFFALKPSLGILHHIVNEDREDVGLIDNPIMPPRFKDALSARQVECIIIGIRERGHQLVYNLKEGGALLTRLNLDDQMQMIGHNDEVGNPHPAGVGALIHPEDHTIHLPGDRSLPDSALSLLGQNRKRLQSRLRLERDKIIIRRSVVKSRPLRHPDQPFHLPTAASRSSARRSPAPFPSAERRRSGGFVSAGTRRRGKGEYAFSKMARFVVSGGLLNDMHNYHLHL